MQQATSTQSSPSIRLFLAIQAVILAAGNYVGWSSIFHEVDVYCAKSGNGLGSLVNFSGGISGNPLLSACFWGSIVFVIAFAWTGSLLFEKHVARVRQQIGRLWWLLLAGTLFALLNNIPIIYKFYTRPAGSFSSCSAGVVASPYLTSCFLGFSAFLAAFLVATLVRQKLATRKI